MSLIGPNGLPLNTITRVENFPPLNRVQIAALSAQLQEILDQGQPTAMPWGVPGDLLCAMASTLLAYSMPVDEGADALPTPEPVQDAPSRQVLLFSKT